MRGMIAGIDYSSFCVDVVLVSANGSPVKPRAYRFMLSGKGSFDRTRKVAEMMPNRDASFWDDIGAIGIEEPAGKGLHYQTRVQGAILSMIPASMTVKQWYPHEWKMAVGLPGNANKAKIVAHAQPELRALGRNWDPSTVGQDCFDAYEIAVATRDALT